MSAFDRIFSLIAGICLAAWLIAVVPVSFNYAKLFGSFSIDYTRKTATTLIAIAVFTLFWGLIAILAKLLLSDWLAARREQRSKALGAVTLRITTSLPTGSIKWKRLCRRAARLSRFFLPVR